VGNTEERAGEAGERTLSRAEWRVWRRLLAGLWLETGLVDNRVTKRGQSAVIEHEYDPDQFAEEVLETTPDELDPRIRERAGRLQRDILMQPLQSGARGALRKARGTARGGCALIVAQTLAISVYSLLLIAALFLLRVRYDFSADYWVDWVLELITPGE